MTNNENYAIRPHKVNVGGIFIAALKGAIQPLSAVVFVPLFLLFPSLGAAFYYHVFSKQNEKSLNFKKGFFKSLDIKSVVASELIYLISLYVTVKAVVYKIQEYFEIYQAKALDSGVLQIGTAEQIEYSQSIKQILYLGGALIFFVIAIIVTNTMIKCHHKDYCTTVSLSIKDAFKALGLNIIGYTLLFVTLGFCFSVLEAYYAQLKLMHLQGYILKTDAFDPTIVFNLLRIYFLHIAFFSLSLFAYASVGLKERISFKK